MIIRTTINEDLVHFEQIYQKYYSEEFKIDEFYDNSINKFTVTDDESPVAIGTIKTLLEISALSDKDKSTRKRVDALIEILHLSKYIAQKTGHKELYVYVLNEEWEKQLKRYGFQELKGKMLVYRI